MADDIKHLLGLGEPNKLNGASGVQAKAFKTAFQATIKEIGKSLNFTAVHAVSERHGELANRRDKTIAAYQAVAKKIDPADPGASEDAIRRVNASATKLRGGAKALQEDAAKHHAAWIENEEKLDNAAAQVTEMVDWDYSKSEKLEEVVNAIRNQAKLRKYKEAVEALEKFLEKLKPAHDDFVVQRDAKVDYDQMVEDNRETLDDFAASSHELLSEWRAEIQGNLDSVEMSVEVLDYYTALANLEAELPVIEDFLTEHAYEAALSDLQPKIDRLDRNLIWSSAATTVSDLRREMESAAASGDFVLALEKLQKLEPELDAELQSMDKADYETAAAAHADAFDTADAIPHEDFYPLVQASESYKAEKKSLDTLVAGEKWLDATLQLQAVATAAKTLTDQRAGFDRVATELNPAIGDYKFMRDLAENAPPNPAWKEELKLLDSYKHNFHNGDFDKALTDLKALLPKVPELRRKVATSDAEALPKAEKAAREIRALVGATNVASLSEAELFGLQEELAKLSPKKQRRLLKDLHAHSAPLGKMHEHSSDLNRGELGAMQQALYQAMEPDKGFVKRDQEFRDAYEAELGADVEFNDAISNWNATDPRGREIVDRAAKEKALRRVLAAQCRAYGIDTPKIEWSELDKNDPSRKIYGKFDDNTDRLVLNPRYLDDPRMMVETVLHENAHHFQDVLVQRYTDGGLSKRDPLYKQAELFAITEGQDAYVGPGDNYSAYERQPVEQHAIEVGLLGSANLVPTT